MLNKIGQNPNKFIGTAASMMIQSSDSSSSDPLGRLGLRRDQGVASPISAHEFIIESVDPANKTSSSEMKCNR